MKVIICLVLLLFNSSSLAGGLPVIDTNQILNELKDSVYLISSVEELAQEVLGTDANILAVKSLTDDIYKLQREIEYYEQISNSVDDLSRSSIGKSKVFVDQVRSITRYIRKVKRVLTLITVLKPRPAAVNSTINMLKEQRQREKEKFELAFKALEEREKIERLRARIQKKIMFQEEIKNEMKIMGARTKMTSVPVPSYLSRKNKSSGSLW